MPPLAAYPCISPVQNGPAPVPTEYGVAELRQPDLTRFVVLQLSTPSGVQVYFFTPEAAKEFARHVGNCAGAIAMLPAGSRLKPVP